MSDATQRSVLRDVVMLGGLALQEEDAKRRKFGYLRGQTRGLAEREDERQQQGVIFEAVRMLWHGSRIECENATDLIVSDGKSPDHFFEMKVWRGKGGESALGSMRRDVAKLRSQSRANAYLLVTSFNPAEMTCENFRYLCEQVGGLQADARVDYRFATKGYHGGDAEFWIAGWPLEPQS
jgi:hypothetical protein